MPFNLNKLAKKADPQTSLQKKLTEHNEGYDYEKQDKSQTTQGLLAPNRRDDAEKANVTYNSLLESDRSKRKAMKSFSVTESQMDKASNDIMDHRMTNSTDSRMKPMDALNEAQYQRYLSEYKKAEGNVSSDRIVDKGIGEQLSEDVQPMIDQILPEASQLNNMSEQFKSISDNDYYVDPKSVGDILRKSASKSDMAKSIDKQIFKIYYKEASAGSLSDLESQYLDFMTQIKRNILAYA